MSTLSLKPPAPPAKEVPKPWIKMNKEERAAYLVAKEAAKGPRKVQVRKDLQGLHDKVKKTLGLFREKDGDVRVFLLAAIARLDEACQEIDELPKEWVPASAMPKSDKLQAGDMVVITDKGKQRFAAFFDPKGLDGEHQITKVEHNPTRCQLSVPNGTFWFPSNVLQRTRKEQE